MATSELIMKYDQSTEEEDRIEIIHKISLSDNSEALSFLSLVTLDSTKDSEERAFALEAMKGHPLAGSDKQYQVIHELFKKESDEDIRLQASIFLGTHGFINRSRAEGIIDAICDSPELDSAIEGLITEIGIKGKGLVTEDQAQKIANTHGANSIDFIVREWGRQ